MNGKRKVPVNERKNMNFGKVLGRGKTRIVYDSNSIFKVAQNDECVISNILEYYFSGQFPNGCFPKVFSHSDDFKIIECEKAVCTMQNKDECRKIYDAIYEHMFLNGTKEKLIKKLDDRKDYLSIFECYNRIRSMDILENPNDIKKLMGEAISEWNTGYIGNDLKIVDAGLFKFYKKKFLEDLKQLHLKK